MKMIAVVLLYIGLWQGILFAGMQGGVTTYNGSCGIGVVVASGGYEHIYCHLHKQRMRRGQMVKAGQVIGQVGMTGRTTGPHLHWGIRYRGRWLDPALILKAMIRSHRDSGAAGP